MKVFLRRVELVLRRFLRPYCWLRKKHRGYWAHGFWICTRCAKRTPAPPPPGTFITDEPAKHVYQVGAKGELRRIDKVRGGKKVRRANREKVKAVERLRQQMLGGEPR